MVALKRIVSNGVVALMVWSFALVLHAEPAPPRQAATPLSHTSAEFLAETAQKNLAGMMLGFQAIQKSDSERVRVYARYLIDDSVKLNKELMELARRNKVLVPLDAIVVPDPVLIALGKKSASEFDRAFILVVINEGERSRVAWQKFFGEAEEGDLKDFASQALADLSYRLTEARVLGREMGLAAKQLNPSPVGEGKPPERPEREPFDTPAPAM